MLELHLGNQTEPAPPLQSRGELVADKDYRMLLVDMGDGRRVSLTIFNTREAATDARRMSRHANDVHWLAPNVRLSDTQD